MPLSLSSSLLLVSCYLAAIVCPFDRQFIVLVIIIFVIYLLTAVIINININMSAAEVATPAHVPASASGKKSKGSSRISKITLPKGKSSGGGGGAAARKKAATLELPRPPPPTQPQPAVVEDELDEEVEEEEVPEVPVVAQQIPAKNKGKQAYNPADDYGDEDNEYEIIPAAAEREPEPEPESEPEPLPATVDDVMLMDDDSSMFQYSLANIEEADTEMSQAYEAEQPQQPQQQQEQQAEEESDVGQDVPALARFSLARMHNKNDPAFNGVGDNIVGYGSSFSQKLPPARASAHKRKLSSLYSNHARMTVADTHPPPIQAAPAVTLPAADDNDNVDFGDFDQELRRIRQQRQMAISSESATYANNGTGRRVADLSGPPGIGPDISYIETYDDSQPDNNYDDEEDEMQQHQQQPRMPRQFPGMLSYTGTSEKFPMVVRKKKQNDAAEMMLAQKMALARSNGLNSAISNIYGREEGDEAAPVSLRQRVAPTFKSNPNYLPPPPPPSTMPAAAAATPAVTKKHYYKQQFMLFDLAFVGDRDSIEPEKFCDGAVIIAEDYDTAQQTMNENIINPDDYRLDFIHCNTPCSWLCSDPDQFCSNDQVQLQHPVLYLAQTSTNQMVAGVTQNDKPMALALINRLLEDGKQQRGVDHGEVCNLVSMAWEPGFYGPRLLE